MCQISKWHRVSIMTGIVTLFLITQFDHINKYNKHVYDSNPYMFADNFNLIPFHRTNLHSKGLKYWYEWIEFYGKYFSSPLTLIHLDPHANDDIISDEIYECSPGQFFQYDQMVISILETTEDLIDNFIDLDSIDNITSAMIDIGYFTPVVWIYPDHWLNFSSTVAYDVHYKLYQQYAQYQTYFITPLNGLKHKYSMLKSTQDPSDKHAFWSDILFKNSIEIVDHALNASESLQIDIIAIPLSALLTDSHLNDALTKHNIVLDIDMDFFSCQNIAENMMQRFEWNHDLIKQLNTILTHHQYLPHHIPNHLYQQALITLMHIITTNETVPINHVKNHSAKISVPRIVDFVKIVSQNTSVLNVYDLQHMLHFLYRLQLETGESFMEPLQLFISTHSYLDEILNEIHDTNTRWTFMPYNHSKYRQHWHQNLAKILNMEQEVSSMDQIFASSSSLRFDAMIVNHTSNNYFEEHILPHLILIKKKHSLQRLEDNDINTGNAQTDEIHYVSLSSDSYSAEDVIQLGSLLHNALQFTKHHHKICSRLIETYLNFSNQNLSRIDIHNLTHFITKQKPKIWNLDHDVFHQHLKREKKKEQQSDSIESLSYPQILQMFGIDPSYKYDDWENIIKQFKNESWSNMYTNNESQPITTDIHQKSFNTSKLKLTARNINEVIHWNKLDKIQQHFLQNGDHRAMYKFLRNLNAKQNVFLKWLLFCFYHPENCEDGHNPFELINHKIANHIFGERFSWNELIRIPSFVESATDEYRGLLQLEFISLGAAQKWLETKPNEENHIATKKEIKHSLNTITKYLSLEQNNIIAGGVELSRGFVPMQYQIWIECLLMKELHQTVFHNTSTTAFLRYQHFVSDDATHESVSSKIPNCLNHITSPYI